MISLQYLHEGWVTKNHALATVSDYARNFQDWAEGTAEDALDVAGMYEEDYDDKKSAKDWRKFSKDMDKIAARMRKVFVKFKSRSRSVSPPLLPIILHGEMEAATFHQEHTNADNYRNVLKQAEKFAKKMEAIK
tara:strand:+ start:1295 stop:1696 length:402 start_codon:yes stop_codon:yes gene_type:complete